MGFMKKFVLIPIPLHPDNLANVILVYCLVIYELRSVAMIDLFSSKHLLNHSFYS